MRVESMRISIHEGTVHGCFHEGFHEGLKLSGLIP